MLTSIATLLQKNHVHRHLFFLLCACLTIVFIGYHFGTFDQAAHIPFLKKWADPTLFPHDTFFDIRFQMYSFFWLAFIPAFKAGVLEPTMFSVHFITIYLSFWFLWLLSKTVFNNPLTSFFTCLLFIFPHIAFTGIPLFEFSLLNRTFVFPFLILSLVLFFSRKYYQTFLLLGFMYNFHVVSVNFFLAMLLFTCLVHRNQIGLKTIIKSLLLFVVSASPVLIWRLMAAPISLTPDPQWFSIITKSSLYHLFFLASTLPQVAIPTLSGITAIFLYTKLHLNSSLLHRHIRLFMIVILIILLVQELSSRFFPITLFVQSQISRAGIYVLLFLGLYLSHFLSQLYQRRSPYFSPLLAISVFSFTPLTILFPYLFLSQKPSSKLFSLVTYSLLLISFIAVLILNSFYHMWYPSINIYPPNSPWHQVQIWAKTHTPKDALFLAPPHKWWLYDSDWRVFSERSTVSTLSELLVGAFVPSYTNYWLPRFNSVAPNAINQFQGDYYQNAQITSSAYASLSLDQISQIAGTYGVDYLVVEKPHSYPLPVVYQNSHYLVYDLSSVSLAQAISP